MILAGQFASKQFVARFRTEAAAAAILQHPNIVAVHDVGVQDGQHYFSMDYVEGQNLSQLVGVRPLHPHQAARYVKLTAEAIHYAHQQGILHRDLKPSNVLIDSATDQPRLTDFGLAKKLDGESSLTVTGQILGSPNFMPPEQASGNRGKVGRQSDVYGLGAILYYLLTARPPFHADSLEGIVSQVLNREPVAPRLLNSSLPRDLETICLKCLEKEPARRYQTPQALADELDHYLRDEPIHARRATQAERAWRWCRRKPALASSFLLIIILLLIVTIGSPIAAYRINKERTRAEHKTLQARQYLYAADMILAQEALDANNLGRAEQLLNRHRPEAGEKDLRDWEWRYLWRRCVHDELRTVRAHDNSVSQLRFLPDGRRFVSSSWDKTVKVWDSESGQLLASLLHKDWVSGLAVSSSGLLASGDWSGIVKLWDWQTRREVRVITHGERVSSLTFTPDGKKLITIGGDVLKIWDVDTGLETAHVSTAWYHYMVPQGIACSPDGLTLAFDKGYGRLRLWDLATGSERAQLEGHASVIHALVFSPDGKTLVSAGWEGTVKVWDVLTRRAVATLTNHTAFVSSAAFSSEGDTLATVSADQTVKLWDTATWQERAALKGSACELWSVTFSPDGQTLVTGGKDGTIKLWNPRRNSRESFSRELPFPNETAFRQGTCVLSPGGTTLLVSTNKNVWSFWETETLKEIASMTVPESDYGSLVIAPGAQQVATGHSNGVVRLWDVKSGHRVAEMTGYTAGIYLLAFSSDGKFIAGLDNDATTLIWDVQQSRLQVHFKAGWWDGMYKPVKFSPDRKSFAIGHRDGTVQTWSLADGHAIATFAGHKSSISGIAFSPDGRTLFTTCADGAAKFWDIATARELATVQGQLYGLTAIGLSPDGKRLATGSGEGLVKLWDTETQQEVATLKGHKNLINGLAFHPDGNTLVSVSREAIFTWRASALGEIEAADKSRATELPTRKSTSDHEDNPK